MQSTVASGGTEAEIERRDVTPQRVPEKAVLVHPVVPGRVYELRIALQRRGAGPISDSKKLSITEIDLLFRDAGGRPLDPSLAGEQPLVPELEPLRIETLPDCEISDEIMAGALASRFMVAPPDAHELSLQSLPEGVAVLRCELHSLNILWSANDADRMREESAETGRLRRRLLERHLPLAKDSELALEYVEGAALCQVETLRARFAPRGDWAPVLKALGKGEDRADFRQRTDRLRNQAEPPPRVGFIGSERGHERLCGMCEVYWLREAEYPDQLALLDLDLIVIETATATGSGVSADDPDWHLAFSGLDGTLPQHGTALLDAASAAGIPVHLWGTTSSGYAKLWRECAKRADRVIVEGQGEEDWDQILGRRCLRVPRATEPAACSMASLRPRDPNRMLIPTASDIFQYPDFAHLVNLKTANAPLLAEFRYRFVRRALDDRLGKPHACVGEHNRTHQRILLQGAGLVLLPGKSLRSEAELLDLAMDAIASGAIPVLFGRPPAGFALLSELDQVFSAVNLMALQALYRTHWVRERRWRELMRFVIRHHTWGSEDREALLGKDPFPSGFDTPRVSVVLVTKRPHLVTECFARFREQTWPNKELLLVFNTDCLPKDLPVLGEGEHVFALPEAANIGECLNRAIHYGTGRYWAKMDDDDFYSSTYLEETAYYYRATQADVVGRQSVYFFFSGDAITAFRPHVLRLTQKIGQDMYIAGASLSADSTRAVPDFSCKNRNSADSHWVEKAVAQGNRIYSADATSIIVYRDADVGNHTWKMGPAGNGTEYLCRGNICCALKVLNEN